MYVDILSSNSYGQYNRKLAKLTNIFTAVYWQEILDIVSIVVRKQKFDSNGFFKLDRNYIEQRTSLTTELQIDAESILSRLNVLIRSSTDPDLISVNLENMVKLLTNEDTKAISKTEKVAAKISRSQKAADKKAGILITMKKHLSEQDPELRKLYEDWVDSVYESGRFLTVAKIQIMEQGLSKYPKQDKQKLLELGIQTGWTEPEWLINKLNSSSKNATSTATKLNSPQKISSSVKTDISF